MSLGKQHFCQPTTTIAQSAAYKCPNNAVCDRIWATKRLSGQCKRVYGAIFGENTCFFDLNPLIFVVSVRSDLRFGDHFVDAG